MCCVETTKRVFLKSGARLSQPQHARACSCSEKSGAILLLHALRLRQPRSIIGKLPEVACRVLAALLIALFPSFAFAGGSGLNVLVVVNPTSPDSLALGNDYCELRHVPPQNVVRLQNWTGGNVTWTRAQFDVALLDPLLASLAECGLDRQVDFVLLSMDIPYEVTEAGSVNSTTSVLFYGFKPNIAPPSPFMTCSTPPFSFNSYAFSESIFRDSPPLTAPANAFLAMMLTAADLGLAKLTVDQGVASDGTFPTAPILLATTSDSSRSVRSVLFDDALFDARIQGNAQVVLTNQDSPYGLTGLLGYQTGLQNFSILPGTFVPGAMADNLTSYGGAILVPNDQTTLLAFLAAGAAGSYGTVVEPCNGLAKFPSPRNYFYQARGFSLAECYYQSLSNPFQGLLVGEPLAAPFARRGAGSWSSLPLGAVLSGTTNLALQFTASDASHPLQQVDLFIDGTFLQTLTNIAPTPGNLLQVSVNGGTNNYTIPQSASLQSIAAGVSDAINSSSNAAQVSALAVGDRIEMHSMDPAKDGGQVSLASGASAGSGDSCTTFLRASRSDFLDSPAFAVALFPVTNVALVPGDSLQLDIVKTNGTRVTLSATNLNVGDSPLQIAESLANLVNSSAALQGPDGVGAQLYTSNSSAIAGTLFIQAGAPGLAPSQIQATLSISSTNNLMPTITTLLNSNLRDTQPRNHLYITAGVTNLSLVFPLDTTALADGQHDLTAVAYEGSHVRTQTPITQSVVISNTPLAAAFVTVAGDTNSAVEGTLAFSVSANTNATAAIELFSTGGSLGVISNQASATFSISGTYLGAGPHPFYAIVTSSNGSQYRTETKWIRLLAEESPFPLAIGGTPRVISWPALAGRRYDILSADILTSGFQFRASILPTNDFGQWMDSESNHASRFYRVRSSPQ